MARQRELRDPVHGFIQRSELEERIIDTGVFQRLRGIKQLAMANLVYPGAVHTRFGHSLGVMHVAGRMAQQLIDDPEMCRVVRLAALLHDIGHGPFSHVSEDVLEAHCDCSKVNLPKGKKVHELISSQIIRTNEEIGRLLSEYEGERVVALLGGTGGESITQSILSGPLDADKHDYLLRDSYFWGVRTRGDSEPSSRRNCRAC